MQNENLYSLNKVCKRQFPNLKQNPLKKTPYCYDIKMSFRTKSRWEYS